MEEALVSSGAIITANEMKPTAADVLKFNDEGRIVDAPSRRAIALQIDAWAGYLPRLGDVTIGAGLVLHDGASWRTTAQVGPGVIGIGLAYRIVPVVELSVGFSALWSTERDKFTPGVYASFAKW